MLLPLLPVLFACAAPTTRPDIVVVVVDALRADRVGCLGARHATPSIDALCADGLSFPNAFSHGADTRSAAPALMSGLHPTGPWLGERLRALGYDAALFSANTWIQAPLTEGFDPVIELDYRYTEGERVDGAALVDQLGAWLATRPPRHPALAWLHLMDVHPPLHPPAPWAGRYASPGSISMFNGLLRRPIAEDELARIGDRYDEAVGYLDTLIGRITRAVDARGRSSVLVLTSDHGEALGEHDQLGHGGALTPEIVRVPLIIRGPDAQGRRVEAAVAHQDLLPTLLGYAGAPDPSLPGVDLRGPIPRDRRLPISAVALDDGRALLGEVAWPWLISAEARYQLQSGEVGPGEPVTPDTSGFRAIDFHDDRSGRLRALGYQR